MSETFELLLDCLQEDKNLNKTEVLLLALVKQLETINFNLSHIERNMEVLR